MSWDGVWDAPEFMLIGLGVFLGIVVCSVAVLLIPNVHNEYERPPTPPPAEYSEAELTGIPYAYMGEDVRHTNATFRNRPTIRCPHNTRRLLGTEGNWSGLQCYLERGHDGEHVL